jgi:hypothetical protein
MDEQLLTFWDRASGTTTLEEGEDGNPAPEGELNVTDVTAPTESQMAAFSPELRDLCRRHEGSKVGQDNTAGGGCGCGSGGSSSSTSSASNDVLLALRCRFTLLRVANAAVQAHLPLVNMGSTGLGGIGHRCGGRAREYFGGGGGGGGSSSRVGNQVSCIRGLLWQRTKCHFVNFCLNSSAVQLREQPEITLSLGVSGSADPHDAAGSVFQQAFDAIGPDHLRPSALWTALPRKGDPVYPFKVSVRNVRIDGQAGSFRDFMAKVGTELRGDSGGHAAVLMPCVSSASGHNLGKHLLRTTTALPPSLGLQQQQKPCGGGGGGDGRNSRRLTYAEHKQFEFFGRLLGVAFRAGIPLALDLLSFVWKPLVGQQLTRWDLYEADLLTAKLLHDVESLSTDQEVSDFLEALAEPRKCGLHPHFVVVVFCLFVCCVRMYLFSDLCHAFYLCGWTCSPPRFPTAAFYSHLLPLSHAQRRRAGCGGAHAWRRQR